MREDLSPSRLEALLADAPMGRPFRFYEETDSTNTDALEWARRGAPHGAMILANVQRRGRGRRGRTWEGGEGRSILASFVLSDGRRAEGWGRIGGAAAVATAQAVRDLTGGPAVTKWPNDVLMHGKKLAGLLPEAVWRGDRLEALIVGIGLNVNQATADLLPQARTPPTSLRIETGKEWDRALLLRRLVEQLARTLALSPGALIAEWESLECSLHREVEVIGEDRRLKGTVHRLLPDGSLSLRGPDGAERQIRWGELSLNLHPATERHGFT
ncbi:MAG: biotin--[acetyl-CoA-carboxylase] ligase [Armatimonadetes bacterium]|nr:biotin--[acetyl-CoA-carboxylase] ligase [Armatimonadota bacterium]